MSREPINLRMWVTSNPNSLSARLYTCGRPGRATYGKQRIQIPDETIDDWVAGLPKADILHIVSLLGEKCDGYSEFEYYPFRSSLEEGVESTFEGWLSSRYDRKFVVHEFPTTDAVDLSLEKSDEVKDKIRNLLLAGRTVLVLDSAGAVRTMDICTDLGYRATSSYEG